MGYKNKICTYYIYNIHESRLNRPESVSLTSLARQLHTLYYTLHTEHAYCLSYRFLNNVVITTVIEMVEMVEILEGRLGKRSVERVRYNKQFITLGHCEIWRHFIRTLYFHSPSAVATREISGHISRLIHLLP